MYDAPRVTTRVFSSPGARLLLCLWLLPCAAGALVAQTESPALPDTHPAVPAAAAAEKAPTFAKSPVAIVALDQSVRGAALAVSGSMQAWNGRAFLNGSGSITAGSQTADVTLPYRGTLRVCSSTTVNLAADTSAPPGGLPGLLMAMDHGAVEMSFATTPTDADADTLITPDFRILISGPGASEVKVRLGNQGDTCVDNGAADGKSSSAAAKADAPYVLVTSLFDAGTYRVQPGQRVLLQHGSLREVVDQEKEPCGCPPAAPPSQANEFPLAQSEGLAPLPPVPTPAKSNQAAAPAQAGNVVPPLVYPRPAEQQPAAVAPAAPVPAPVAAPEPAKAARKPGVFRRIGHFFKRVFGAEP